MHGNIQRLSGRSRQALLAAALALCVRATAQGQLDAGTPEAVDEEQIRRYTVELIVFEYTSSTLAGNEQFLPDEPLPEEGIGDAPRSFGDPGAFVEPGMPLAIDEVGTEEYSPPSPNEPLPDEELEELPSHIIQTQLQVLDPGEHAMKDIYAKLLAIDGYRPIMRAAWTQLVTERDRTLPIKLRRLGNAPLRLDGTVMLYLSRYLHFVVDLTIEVREEPRTDRYDAGARYYGDRSSSARYRFGYDREAAPIRYTISEDRIFRSGELRYYDHPKFGVLVRVSRFEEELPETDEMFLSPAQPVGAL